MNEWFETHPFLKQMRRRLSVELAVCLLLFCGVFLAARYAGLASAGADAVLGKKKPVVFLDAGHGDFDPGKVSVDGSLEKDINLAIAKRLKWYLEQSDVEVVMSREDDRGLYDTSTGSRKMSDMKNRCARVEESGADLVVSIHQNSGIAADHGDVQRICQHPALGLDGFNDDHRMVVRQQALGQIPPNTPAACNTNFHIKTS